MVTVAWECFLETVESIKSNPRFQDWDHLGWATKRAGILPYYAEQIRSFKRRGNNCADIAKPASYYLNVRESSSHNPPTSILTREAYSAVMAFVHDANKAIGQWSQKGHLTPDQILSIPQSIFLWPSTVPEQWQQSLYDELSSNAANPFPADSPFLNPNRVASNPSGIPHDKLRFHHWKGLNSLLIQVAAFEKRKERWDTEKSMLTMKEEDRKFLDGSVRPNHLPWILEHLDDIKKESAKQYNEQEWRAKILDLRGINIDANKHVQELGSELEEWQEQKPQAA